MAEVPIQRHRLDNGLRVILSRDPRAPVVAVNLWYDVGSKHEKAGKTGFAHLFEHMMFQGSANVQKGQHFSLIQAAGGTLNASTWLDRTNYYETLPGHELELALWLEADRMASLLPAMTQEKLDNQRDVVKNERRWSVDNQPYGDWDELVQALGILFICFTAAIAVALADAGALTVTNAGAAAFATVPTVLGLWLGQRLRRYVSAETFRRMFLIVLLGLGINMARTLF